MPLIAVGLPKEAPMKNLTMEGLSSKRRAVMMMSPVRLLCAGIICGGLFASAGAWANIYFRDSDRITLRNYIFAPADRGILYHPGSPLPENVNYTELPPSITVNLPPPPKGAVYVSSGGNVYLLDRSTRMVVDSLSVY
jgi:hypothetical protein